MAADKGDSAAQHVRARTSQTSSTDLHARRRRRPGLGDGNSALLMAADRGRHAVVSKCLASSGANSVNESNSWGLTPLMAAAARGHTRTAVVLPRAGASKTAELPHSDPIDAGMSALHMAAKYGHTQCAEALARAGCKVAKADAAGRTAAEVATYYGHKKLAATLKRLERGQTRTCGPTDRSSVQPADRPIVLPDMSTTPIETPSAEIPLHTECSNDQPREASAEPELRADCQPQLECETGPTAHLIESWTALHHSQKLTETGYVAMLAELARAEASHALSQHTASNAVVLNA